MPDRMKISDEITVGAQPSEAELKAMAEDGVKTIINLRPEGEEMQPMSPEEEGQKTQGFGMKYIHLPFSSSDASPQLVDRFRDELRQAPKPVFVHCKLGKRAGAMAMMDQGVRQGLSGDQLLEQAERKGFECDNEDLAQFVKDYVDTHRGSA